MNAIASGIEGTFEDNCNVKEDPIFLQLTGYFKIKANILCLQIYIQILLRYLI